MAARTSPSVREPRELHRRITSRPGPRVKRCLGCQQRCHAPSARSACRTMAHRALPGERVGRSHVLARAEPLAMAPSRSPSRSSSLPAPDLAAAAATGRAGAARTATASPETGLLPEWTAAGPPLAWKATGIGRRLLERGRGGGRIFTLGDRDGAQQVIALERGRRQAALDGQARRALERRDGRPARHAHAWTATSSTRSAPRATWSAWRPPPARSAGARAWSATSAAT